MVLDARTERLPEMVELNERAISWDGVNIPVPIEDIVFSLDNDVCILVFLLPPISDLATIPLF